MHLLTLKTSIFFKAVIQLARIVSDWYGQNHNFTPILLPAEYRGINIMESCWAKIISNGRIRRERTEADMKKIVSKIWDNIKANYYCYRYFESIISSIPKRLEEIINHNSSA